MTHCHSPKYAIIFRPVAIVFAVVIGSYVHLAGAQEPLIVQLEQSLERQAYDEAVEIGQKIDEQASETTDTTLPLARLARALQQAGRLNSAADFYQRAVLASERPTAASIESDKKVLVRLAAGAVMTEVHRLSDAVEVLRPTLKADSGASDSQREMAISILLRIGATALAIGATDVASQAYTLASEHAGGNEHATAMLGDAWAMAIERKDPIGAAKKLAAFIDRYPDHVDAPRAARACAECLKQGDRAEDASNMLSDLLRRWPDSESAFEVVASHRDRDADMVPSAVRHWLIESAEADRLAKLDVNMAVLGLQAASQEQAFDAWARLLQHLAVIDETGQATSDLLVKLVETGREAEAERLVSVLIAPKEGQTVTAAAREAACRWAGRTQHWSMLALASESQSPSSSDPSQTDTVARLFAESLMQTGRVDSARTWWDHLVDARECTDFSTLLRCAEAETSAGNDADKAQQRIVAARNAAADDRFQHALVDLLEAELSIRRTDFDQARSLLEQVVRMNEAEAGLRGRAQWLIGETHYLQQNFADAIQAYRRVEGIDPGGMWISAALVQAGKSFEQLGRPREAAVCYGNLLNHHPETAHAELARRRLAELSPETAAPIQSSPPTIRR